MHQTTCRPKQVFSFSIAQRVCALLAGLIAIGYGGGMLWSPRPVIVSAGPFSKCVEIPAGKPVSAEKWGSQGMYFVAAATSPVRARLLLPTGLVRGQDLWLVHGVADNHCQIKLRSGQSVVAEIDNARLIDKTTSVFFLSYFGHVPENANPLEFEFGRQDGKPYYAEIAGLIVASPGTERADVVAGLYQSAGPLLIRLAFLFLGLFAATAAVAPGFCAVRLPYVLVGIVLSLYWTIGLPSSNMFQDRTFVGYWSLDLAAELKTPAMSSSPICARLRERVNRVALAAFPYDSFDNSLHANQVKDGAIHGNIDVEAFSGPAMASVEVPSQSVLGGLLHRIQARKYERLLRHLEYLALAVVIAGGLATWTGRRGWIAATLLLLFVTSMYLSLRVSQGWDELYMNLRHSYMLESHGAFSANANSMVEGTVDSLPFFLIGLLGKTGLRLDDLAIAFSLAGNLLIICVAFDIVRTTTCSIGYALLAAAAAALFPCVVFVGGSGFMATLFTGVLLLGLDLIYVRGNERNLYAFLPLAILPLIRTEGVLFCLLVFCQQYLPSVSRCIWQAAKRRRAIVDALVGGTVLASGFIAISILRRVAFGDWLPIPIVCKATANDPAYLKGGVLQMLAICQSFRLEYLWIVLGMALLLFRADANSSDGIRWKSITALLLAGLFTIPYFLGGGDWFPLQWARYAMPLVLVTVIMTCVIVQRAMASWMGRWWPLGIGLSLVPLICVCGERSDSNAYQNLSDDVKGVYNRWVRIDRLAPFGEFLKTYSTPGACIASPEVATIPYYAQREMLDLLGVSNPDIAQTRLYPICPGDLMQRKRNPDTIRKHMPEIIALYEMVHPVTDEAVEEPGGIFQTVGRSAFNQRMVEIGYYRAGDFEELRKLGYRHLAIKVPGYLFNFFATEAEFGSLRDRLTAANYRYVGKEAVPYQLSERMVRNYSSR